MTTGRINQVAFVAVLGFDVESSEEHRSDASDRPHEQCTKRLPAALAWKRFLTKLLVCLHLRNLLERQSHKYREPTGCETGSSDLGERTSFGAS